MCGVGRRAAEAQEMLGQTVRGTDSLVVSVLQHGLTLL